MRAEVVAANMANAETTRTADGGPYRRQHVVFQQAGGDGFAESLRCSNGLARRIGAIDASLAPGSISPAIPGLSHERAQHPRLPAGSGGVEVSGCAQRPERAARAATTRSTPTLTQTDMSRTPTSTH